jgi:hypothetical protein
MAHQRTEILAMLAAGRGGADIARIFRCIAPRLAASQRGENPSQRDELTSRYLLHLAYPTQLAVETPHRYVKADSLMISIGCRGAYSATN